MLYHCIENSSSEEKKKGNWWKNVDHFPDDSAVGVTITRDPKALRKEEAPIWWRFQHKWTLLKVRTSKPYHLYFFDGKAKMVYWRPITEKQVAVRIGPQDVRFVALETGTEMPLEIFQIPGPSWTWRQIREIKAGTPELRAYGYLQYEDFILV